MCYNAKVNLVYNFILMEVLMKKIVALSLLLAVSLLAAVGFAYAQADGEITIGVFEPVTGENGGGGFQEVLGVRYANQVYPEITVGGKTYKINLFEVDNKSDKTEAVTAVQNLVSKAAKAMRLAAFFRPF